jgi:serine/threonine-protein kinase
MDPIKKYNDEYLEKLAEILRNGDGVGLIGAGSSIACGYPGWRDFLKELEQPLQRIVNMSYLKELRAKDIRTRLDRMARILDEEYPRIFQKTFRPHANEQEVPHWIQLLFDLNLRLLLTTNYTTELEEAASMGSSKPSDTRTKPVRWFETSKFANAIRRTQELDNIIYLHGRWDDSPEIQFDEANRKWSRVVLGEISYKYAYEHPGVVKEMLDGICKTSTLLFIGSSLDDEDITGVLRSVSAVSGEQADPHYAILPLLPGENLEGRESELKKRFRIQPLFYEVLNMKDNSEDHSALEALLKDLVKRISPKLKVSKVAPTSAVEGKPFTENATGIRMLWVPGGRFQIGLGRREGKTPWVELSPYWIGEMPVTNQQYANFLEETGYEEPGYWQNTRFSDPPQPVVGVSWNDAINFCGWLSKKTGLNWSLCTEAQWEFAARSDDARVYPWGNEELTPIRARYNQDSVHGRPLPAGSHVKGRGPFGTLEQAGSVWEWCFDVKDDEAYQKWFDQWPDGAFNPVMNKEEGLEYRVLRGGCWADEPYLLESKRRYCRYPEYKSNRVGFRVAVNPEIKK